jgi:hypothetical protein
MGIKKSQELSQLLAPTKNIADEMKTRFTSIGNVSYPKHIPAPNAAVE